MSKKAYPAHPKWLFPCRNRKRFYTLVSLKLELHVWIFLFLWDLSETILNRSHYFHKGLCLTSPIKLKYSPVSLEISLYRLIYNISVLPSVRTMTGKKDHCQKRHHGLAMRCNFCDSFIPRILRWKCILIYKSILLPA